MSQKPFDQSNSFGEVLSTFHSFQEEFANALQDPNFRFVRLVVDTAADVSRTLMDSGILPEVQLFEGLEEDPRSESDTRFSTGAPALTDIPFRQFDLNNDDVLSLEEVRAAIRRTEADRDGDGHISKEEDKEWARGRGPRETLRPLEQLGAQFQSIAVANGDDEITVSRADIRAFFAQRQAE